ncbi:amidohydrolase [Pseudoalteromonas sp. MMG013]|uniref:amidohydrolase n=1 Tax=Pseudoalteromonas sp. MMG013 TaxID=2822687 RepID=UPI001B38F4FB|nr:amidohydrolase [Pseudoalteromonas sp. MMG013]MBQ4864730.1 amidohydrolase [Pseudoalteromonas sp. MMG013]
MNHDNCNHDCAQCACHNPLWNSYETQESLSNFTQSIKEYAKQLGTSESLLPAGFVMYSGGVIRPMINGSTDQVEAIGFANGKVFAVGNLSDVSAQMRALGMQPNNHLILEENQTLLPGLIEPHVHIVPTALTMGWIDLGAFTGQHLNPDYSLDYVLNQVKQFAPEKPGDWILGTGVDPALMPFEHEGECKDSAPQLADITVVALDKLRDDNTPIFLMSASLHTAYVNTAALEKIKPFFPADEQIDFVKNITEQGALQELSQIFPAFSAIPKSQNLSALENLPRYIAEIFSTANKRGVTMMYEAGMKPMMCEMLKLYRKFTPHNMRVGYAKLCESVADAEALTDFTPITEQSLAEVFQAGVKLVSDGSNQGLTGYQSEQYSCNPVNNYGIFNYSYDATEQTDNSKPNYQKMVNTIINKGWPILIHANGNHAIDIALDVYENALAGESGIYKRHRIEHCSLLSDYSAKRMQEIGISPSFLIGHVGYWGYAFEKVIFKSKSHMLDRCKTMLDLNSRITLHSDLSVSPTGPLRMMEQAVTRIMEKSSKHHVLNESECITREQALKAITYDAAWQCHVDEWVGSLAKNKLADYVILAEDPLTISDAKKIRDIPVLQTWVGGKLRYQYQLFS